MKFILMLAVALAGIWLWRTHRDAEQAPRRDAPPPPQPMLQDMVRCPVCAVHVPRTDAVAGRQGLYCCAEHRRRAEG
ncbi:PP0621 family protein [Polaromonas sp. C04]|uniref:PP0621 family protein n=1 Tax=Polaromonas sp. C04 TaxID=1945857 RepID=UPI0009846010|nr:PP0621 family protein [Polaromonas sp. C04]OOG50717.1 hypothetical protein B0E49_18530 [Polaromonas sp. C04]